MHSSSAVSLSAYTWQIMLFHQNVTLNTALNTKGRYKPHSECPSVVKVHFPLHATFSLTICFLLSSREIYEVMLNIEDTSVKENIFQLFVMSVVRVIYKPFE